MTKQGIANPGRSVSNWQLPDASDGRLQAGYRRQRSALEALLAKGDRVVGFKVGANDPASQRRLGLSGPIYGFLTHGSVIDANRPIVLGGAVLAGVEAELAMTIEAPVAAQATIEDIGQAIGGMRLAAELIDVDRRYDDLEGVLAGNVFHRSVAFADPTRAVSAAEAMQTALLAECNGKTAWNIPIGFVLGDPREAVRFIARALAVHGQALRRGDVVISGLLLPLPIWVKPGDCVRLAAGALGEMSLNFKE